MTTFQWPLIIHAVEKWKWNFGVNEVMKVIQALYCDSPDYVYAIANVDIESFEYIV